MRFPQAADDLPKRVPVVNGWSTHQEALLADGRLPETLILDRNARDAAHVGLSY
jgi:hypothetical protein